ncbi:MAG: hypothetical protein ACLQFR_08650 [Streptosporangiaceae bacterium]
MTAAVVCCLTSAVGLPALASTATVSPGNSPVAATTARSPLLLVTGQRLAVRQLASGGRTIALLAGAGAPLVSIRQGSLTEEIPAEALAYLGRGLDPSLFNVGALQRAETAGRLPVDVSFAGRPHALPGLTVTRSAPGREQGYLTAAGAKLFGTALVRQFRADHRTGRYGIDGLFAGGADIALRGVNAAVQRPGFRLDPLTLRATNMQGRPDSGDMVMVLNTDNPARFEDFLETTNIFYRGSAKFSVPPGHYWAIGQFFTFGKSGSLAWRLVVLPQFTVQGSTTVHLAERAASSQIGFVTPRPAVAQQLTFTVARRAANGASFTSAYSAGEPGVTLWVSPTATKPTVGTMTSFTSGQLASPPKAPGIPYEYNLNYAGPAGIIPAQQEFTATAATLAAVTQRYVQDVPSAGGWGVFGGFPQELRGGILFAIVFPISLPVTRIQYFSAGPLQAWSSFYIEFLSSFAGGQSGPFQVLPPAAQLAEDWNADPLHPQPDVQQLPPSLGVLLPQLPSAFRAGNTLTLYTTPFSDNTPGHFGTGYYAGPGTAVTGSYAVYQDGVRIAHGNPVNGIAPVKLSPKPSVLTFVLTAGRFSPSYPLSSASSTTWTWRSAPRFGAEVPPSWFCGFTKAGRLLRSCAVQPMMTVDYQVQGLQQDGRAPDGAQRIDLSFGHLQLAGDAAVTGASAQYSYNDGQTWQTGTVTPLGGGRFQMAFNAPGGVDVTLRVHATDAAGGAITETILRAYGVSL